MTMNKVNVKIFQEDGWMGIDYINRLDLIKYPKSADVYDTWDGKPVKIGEASNFRVSDVDPTIFRRYILCDVKISAEGTYDTISLCISGNVKFDNIYDQRFWDMILVDCAIVDNHIIATLNNNLKNAEDV